MDNKFYLACFRDNVGSSVGFHCINGRGYSTNISQAHIYTQEEAQYHWNMGREYDQPISVDCVDALAVWKVDYQYIPNESKLFDDVSEYVAFMPRKWDGNDVYWVTAEVSKTTADFSKANIFNLMEARALAHVCVVIPYRLADLNKRRTFQYSDFDVKTMAKALGLKAPKRAKSRRNPNAKTRFNCPHCGKITWQNNPYDFMGCKDIDCEGYRDVQF